MGSAGSCGCISECVSVCVSTSFVLFFLKSSLRAMQDSCVMLGLRAYVFIGECATSSEPSVGLASGACN